MGDGSSGNVSKDSDKVRSLMERFSADIETHDRRSNKIYNFELTMILKYEIKYIDEIESNHRESG